MSAAEPVETQLQRFAVSFQRLREELAKVIVGQQEAIESVSVALLAGGHVLLEGLPGLGKTRLVRTLAQALDLEFRRIQFTPDLMPADIIGTTILRENEQGRRVFEFQKGPVFGHVILADEINRATPKTQSALLEAMQEGSVTVGGVTHTLAQPFFVLATQNPIELEGTYPLPEAQLDRFLLKVMVTYSSLSEMVAVLDRTTGQAEPAVSRALDRQAVLELRGMVRAVLAAQPVKEFAARLVLATHPEHESAPAGVKSYVRYGASTRGAQALLLCAKVWALCQGRGHVAVGDLQRFVKPALRHRLILNYDGEASGVTADKLLDEVAAQVE